MPQKKLSRKRGAKKGQPRAAAPRVGKKYVSGKIGLGPLSTAFSRADLVFEGVDHAGVSYEGRIFLNNEGADEKTPKTPSNGYAGSYHIFGHGGCFGDVGHCDIHGLPRAYDPRP